MEISEAQGHKTLLEVAILTLIQEYEKKTGTHVDGIHLHTSHKTWEKYPTVYSVEVIVNL